MTLVAGSPLWFGSSNLKQRASISSSSIRPKSLKGMKTVGGLPPDVTRISAPLIAPSEADPVLSEK